MPAFSKLTELVDGEPRIVADPPLIEPIQDLAPGVDGAALDRGAPPASAPYRQTLQTDRRVLLEEFRLVDVARKVVGVGSVGTRAWIVLFPGATNSDPLFLQFKEAQASVLEDVLRPRASTPTTASAWSPAST